jgi:tetratricopeptide (TPR) repeat protein
LLLFFGVCFSTVWAQPTSEEQAKQLRIDSLIRVAQEEIKRGFYQQAEVRLNSLQTSPEYAPYLTEQQNRAITDLLSQSEQAVEQRQQIAQKLQASDELAAAGDYRQAADILDQIKDSPYATAQEKQMIADSYEEVTAKYRAEQQKWQALYDTSVQMYNGGNKETARQGFMQVVNAGYPVTGSISPEDYILKIDTEKQPAAVQTDGAVDALIPLVQEPWDTLDEEIDSMQPLTTEPVEPLTEGGYTAPQPEQSFSASPAASQDESYLQVVRAKNERLRSYTEAVVTDAMEKAERFLAVHEFDQAKQAIRRAFATIEQNKMLLGDAQYKSGYARLSSLDQKIDEERITFNQQQARQRETAAAELTQQIRRTMETQRAEAIENYMERTFAFMDEQRYEEALGQLEQLLTIDPLNQRALILRQSLEHTIRYIEQRDIQRQSDAEELKLLLETDRRAIPYASEINYPRNWKEISARREAAAAEGLSPADVAVNIQLDKFVDLSMLTEDTTFEEAVSILRNSVDPPLTIIVLWGDLSENAFIEKTTPINMNGDGLTNVVLRTALRRLLQSVSSGGFAELGYVVEEGIITIATVDSLPTNFRTEIYDVADLLNPPADWDEDRSNNQQGSGGSSGGSGGGMMGGGMGGGMMGGGMMGGGMGGMGGMGGGGMMGGGMGGGGGGSGSSNDMGGWRQMYRAYQLIYTIQQTVEPDTWYDEGGEGRIDQYSGSKLIIWQTPEAHKQINDLLEKLRADLGQQVAIEARFLLVDENFLEDIGIDTTINFRTLGGVLEEELIVQQGSYELVSPTATGITSSLGGEVANNPALFTPGSGMTFEFGSLDDLQVSFIIRATQAHRNAKTLTAPKVAVLNGESATLSVMTAKRLVTDSTINTETTVTQGLTSTNFWWTHETEDIDSGVQLTVTPVITSDKKYVLLRIIAQLQDILAESTETATAIVNGDPQTDSFVLPTQQQSTVRTRVTVPDRGTILLGGLTLTANRELESGVPVLSKVPVLGRFFSNRSEVRDKQILLIMVKPTIVLKDEAEADAMAAMER